MKLRKQGFLLVISLVVCLSSFINSSVANFHSDPKAEEGPHACTIPLKAGENQGEVSSRIRKRIDKVVRQLAKKYPDRKIENFRTQVLNSQKELTLAFGSEPTTQQLYQFFRKLWKVQQEHLRLEKSERPEFQTVVIKPTVQFKRWIELTPKQSVVVSFDESGRMYLLFRTSILGEGEGKVVRQGIAFENWHDVAVISQKRGKNAADDWDIHRLFVQEKMILAAIPKGTRGLATSLGSNQSKIFQKLYQGSLADYLKKNAVIPVQTQLQILDDVSNGLNIFQQAGFVHGDVKLDNIFYADSPSGIEVALGDFGLASQPAIDLKKGREKSTAGTLRYMAPEAPLEWLGSSEDEQIENARKADVYSLGMTAVELTLGVKKVSEVLEACGELIKMFAFFQCKADQTPELISQLEIKRKEMSGSKSSSSADNVLMSELIRVEEKMLSVHPNSRLSIAETNAALHAIRSGTFNEDEFIQKHKEERELNVLGPSKQNTQSEPCVLVEPASPS